MNIQKLLRENISKLLPYSSARSEFKGEASVYLDANESPYNTPLNRYPDPQQLKVKEAISAIKNIAVENIFLGNGSDEAIDLLFRAFCEPGIENVVAIEPTYGMYKVCADINNVEYRPVLLNENFDIEAFRLIDASNVNTKIIWLCSPNNPTANILNKKELLKVLTWFRGIVVVDEAYIDFADTPSFTSLLSEYSNLVVLQTLSKAWAHAGIRLGMAFASVEIIEVLNKIKYPYNISIALQDLALKALKKEKQVAAWVDELKVERENLAAALKKLAAVRKVHPSDANFLLVEVTQGTSIYHQLTKKGIIVRNRSNITLCDNCLRITIGKPEENAALLAGMKRIRG